jgi:hypothetical protein
MIAVPVNKDTYFSQVLLTSISNSLSDLYLEYEQLPNLILFQGPLGREVLLFIQEAAWDFKKFNPTYQDGPNQIVFKYTTPIKQVEEKGPVSPSDGLNGRVVNGIPNSSTMSKITGAYAGGGFSIERTVRPELCVKLKRKI